MKNFCFEYVLFVSVCFVITKQQNSTDRVRKIRDPNLMSALQQMQLQLNSLESEGQRHNARIQDVLRATTRLEAQRQELIGILDRSESHLSQRMEDVKGDIRKILTLQDIIREDVDKIEQNQILTKAWMQEQFQSTFIPSATRPEVAGDPTQALANTDILTNLQVLQSTLQGLRRMGDIFLAGINTIKLNLTDLTNLTRSISIFEKDYLVTKNYLQSAFLTAANEKTDPIVLGGCQYPSSNQGEEDPLPRDCFQVQRNVQNETGVYRIQPLGSSGPIFAFCDMETEGGGWTVFQRRRDGSVDFLREWQDYKYGFGNVGGEFWLGNENLHRITHQDLYELRIDLEDFEGGKSFTTYGGFAVGSEKEKYILKLLGPIKDGDAGDGMTYHASMPFSTIDVDHDRWEGGHCAKDHLGGWWYNQCDASNLNGKYLNGLNPNEYQGVYWHEWHGPSYSLMATKMMVRPIGRKSFKPYPDYNSTSLVVTSSHSAAALHFV